MRFCLNIDHFATVRNSRGGDQPDPILAALIAEQAGADGIMIHSKFKQPDEIFRFCDAYMQLPMVNRVPLVVVPSTYSQVTEKELAAHGVRIVIYANQLLRSAYPAMWKTAETILMNGRAEEADTCCISIKEILKLI